MAQQLHWFYDAFVLGIALITMYCGYKRGFMRSVVLIVLMAASVVVSWFISTVGAPALYEKAIQPPIMSALNNASEKTNPLNVVSSAVINGNYGVEMTDPELEGIITNSESDKVFDNIAEELKQNGSGAPADEISSGVEGSVTEGMLRAIVGDVVSPETLTEILNQITDAEADLRRTVNTFLRGDKYATAEAVEDLLIAPVVKTLLKGIIWVVSMMILTVIVKFISNAFVSLNKLPVIGPINAVAGALFGLCEGIVIIYVAAQAVKLVCCLTSDSLMFLNTQTAQSTIVFKYFFDFDFISFFSKL